MCDSRSTPLRFSSNSPEQTAALAARFAEVASAGDYLALDGPLGAGKTMFTQAFCQALGIDPREVDSPSFVLLNRYEGRLPVFHFDAYRLDGDAEELAEAGFFDETLDAGVTLVEWAQRIEAWLPASAVRVEILAVGDKARTLVVHNASPALRRVLEGA